MKQTTKDKIRKTLWLLAGPMIVLYVVLTFVLIQYEPERFVTVPNDCKGSSCYNFVVTDGPTYLLGPEYDIDYVREPETFQKQVDYMGIGDYMLMIPLVSVFAGGIGSVVGGMCWSLRQ